MALKYFKIDRIKRAIEHLQNYDSNWVIVPLVFAVNGVNTREQININDKHGGDTFLNKHFSGSLMGLEPFPTGINTLRPRFSDLYGNMKNSGRENDYVLHQNTKLWANVYSSRGYREMRTAGTIQGSHSRFQLGDTFKKLFAQHLPKTFLFEELLVWLYAFSGLDDSFSAWQNLYDHFQSLYLDHGNAFEPEYTSRFRLNNLSWTETDFLPQRPADSDFQEQLYPSKFLMEEIEEQTQERPSLKELNKIIYGPPGVGKSYSIKQEMLDLGEVVEFTTTFHPEYSYADFVGSFRPATEQYGTEAATITYRFRPEVFTKAYVEAWQNPQQNVFLIIEEINRGNSPAIFGDVFQLLDRDDDGYSEYAISCKEEIGHYLQTVFKDTDYSTRVKSTYSVKYGKELNDPYSIMLLPNNLGIRATMNTSDQSLFPMDTAFKRRWTWQYTPIRYNFTDKVISVNGKHFSWNLFLQRVNDLIYETMATEDKCIGVHFMRGKTVSAEDFRNKVIFYLWNDVLRDELPETKLRAFPSKRNADGHATDYPVVFNDFFDPAYGWQYVEEMLLKLGIEPISEDAPSI